jgi:hypothetical protein
MANEINLNVAATVLKGSTKDSVALGAKQITMAGNKIYRDVLSLTTSPVAAGKGSVGSLGLIFITADSANGANNVIVYFDGAGTTAVLTLAAGVTACLPMAPAFTIANMMLKMSASTGAASIQIWEA